MKISFYSKRSNHTGLAAFNLWFANCWTMMKYYVRNGEWSLVWRYYFRPVVRLRKSTMTGKRTFWFFGQLVASFVIGWEPRTVRVRLTKTWRHNHA